MAGFADKVRFVGFCGADDSVDATFLQILSIHYPWIEWGVLFRSDLQGTARYASPEWVRNLSTIVKASWQQGHSFHLAGHLCFDRCQQILQGESAFVKELYELGFRRIQVNITKANGVIVDPTQLPLYVQNIRAVMREVAAIEWIFQLNTETQPIWDLLFTDLPSNVSVLHDASCGKGVQITEFPSPQNFGNIPSGYAGGIGPKTIDEILGKVSAVVDPATISKPVWIDMESSLRTIVVEKGVETDIFDLNKCMTCIQAAVKAGLERK